MVKNYLANWYKKGLRRVPISPIDYLVILSLWNYCNIMAISPAVVFLLISEIGDWLTIRVPGSIGCNRAPHLTRPSIVPYPAPSILCCDQCDYRASSRASVNFHKNTKHEGVRHPCDQCNHTAPTKRGVLMHIKAKHLLISNPVFPLTSSSMQL